APAAADAPIGPLESELAAIVRELLGIEHVGATRDLFEFGLHSILLMKLRVRVDELYNIALPLRELFERPTIRRIAELIVEGQANASSELDRLLAEVAGLSDEEAAALLEDL